MNSSEINCTVLTRSKSIVAISLTAFVKVNLNNPSAPSTFLMPFWWPFRTLYHVCFARAFAGTFDWSSCIFGFFGFSLRTKEIPPQDSYLKKMVKSTRLLIFQVLSGPLNPILKKWVVTLILGEETGFDIACIAYITNWNTCNFKSSFLA